MTAATSQPDMAAGRLTRRAAPGRNRRRWWWRTLAATGVVVAVTGWAGLGNLIGLPAILAVPVAVAIGLVARRAWSVSSPTRLRRAIAIATLVAVSATTFSYTGYLTAPGSAAFDVRTADWMRDHGMGPIVDQIELRLYGGGRPGNGPVTASQLPGPVTAARTPKPAGVTATVASSGTTTPVGDPRPVGSLLDATLAGEGLWTPNARTVGGAPVTYTTFFRPDPDNTDVVAAAVWLDPATTHLVYVPGTKEPGGTGWAWHSGIPTSQRAQLVAAFNSGWKFKDTVGGVFTEGRTARPLVDGEASLVIHKDGRADIGTWGRDVTMAPDTVTVRQNLRLVVDHAKPVGGLSTSIAGEWGKRLYQMQYTTRSGLGVTPDGALVYVAGSDLTTQTLADSLARAGAVRGMELDIHRPHPAFTFFQPSTAATAGVTATKLLPNMKVGSPPRFLAPDQRDFFAVMLR